ncbi:MAG: DJ-1/PfpI family protein [Candidatus Aenigmarchaeota archaeon]|nr:DJ-1/PfpI family protein [Candidatus Aenigmarchaeota archaeon]
MRAFVILAEGFEEIEAFTVIDVLRRAKIDTASVGLISKVVSGAHGITTMAEYVLSDIKPDNFDMVILPGGDPGYRNLANSEKVLSIVKDYNKKRKFIAAICAAPYVLAKAGVLDDKIATIYPGMESKIPKPRDAKVVVHDNIITSKSPGTAMDFAVKLAEILAGKAAARKVSNDLVLS